MTASERARAYYVQNRERILARVKARAEAKREEIAAYKKQWWAQNAETFKADKRASYAAHRDEVRRKQQEAYAADTEDNLQMAHPRCNVLKGARVA